MAIIRHFWSLDTKKMYTERRAYIVQIRKVVDD